MKIPVVLLMLILVVGPSTFLGGTAISQPVSAQSSPVGSFTVTWDLVTSQYSIHILYSGQIEYSPDHEYWVATASGSCAAPGGSAAPSEPLPGQIFYDSNSGTIQFFIAPNNPNVLTQCAWPPSGMSINFPATIQNGMAVSSDSIVRPCLESGNIPCSDTVSWDIAVPLPPVPPPPNHPPTANAGPDQTVNSESTVTLDGSGSSDADPGDTISYSWSASDSSITLNGADTANPTFVAPKVDTDTTITFSLGVTDSHGAQSQPDSADVLVKASLPPPPPPPPPQMCVAPPTSMSSLPDSSNIQLNSSPRQCKIKVVGNVFLQTPPSDRGDIFIPNLKVELCSTASENNCPVATFTDSSGKYELSTDTLAKNDARLQITFSNKDRDMLTTLWPNNDPAIIRIADLPFVTDPITGDSVAEVSVKFSGLEPFVFINNQPGGLSVTAINTEVGLSPAIAAVFYYIELGLQFSKQSLPIAINYNMPLKVKVFAPDPSNFKAADTSINYGVDPSFTIDDGNQRRVEPSLDILFHEFGHFLVFEIFRGSDPTDASLHPAYIAAGPEGKTGDCHHGYAHLDSSCAMEEGKALFFSALIQDRALNPNHAQYKKNSVLNYDDPNTFQNLEDPYNIAGIKQFKKSPFFKHAGGAEEVAIGSLLWDLYDNTPNEFLGGSLGNDKANLNLNDLINSLIFATTTSQYLFNLFNVLPSSVFQPIDSVFANHGVCIDSNNNGECEVSEVGDGRSAWKVKYKNIEYGYPYPGYKHPGGRP